MAYVIIVIAVVLVLLVVAVLRPQIQWQSFEERFPLMTDAEFVAHCSPGTNPDVALKVRRIIAAHLAVDYERIHPSTRFIDDLGAD
ncbi:MAG TPA: hypothetical protein VHR66_30260 [Gemmataceae bacterium]|jgi:hypothetical protein|nr:hypothetical protein [Gemmataceae bacterium]